MYVLMDYVKEKMCAVKLCKIYSEMQSSDPAHLTLLRQTSLVLHQDDGTSQQHSLLAKNLPSSNYQFSRWFELNTNPGPSDRQVARTEGEYTLRGSALHSPRVREGPRNVTSQYASHSVMYCKRSLDWKDYRNVSEDWEHTEVVNLSYQNLGDEYQLRNFHRCLSRLHLCKRLQLMDNSLSSIKKVTLPSCVYLNLSRNRITSFTSLPMSPNLEHLSIANNNIVSMTNLQSLARKYPHLKTLTMKGNPAADAPDYRYRVFQVLPRLELLDDCPPLPTDQDCFSSHSCSTIYSYKCTLC